MFDQAARSSGQPDSAYGLARVFHGSGEKRDRQLLGEVDASGADLRADVYAAALLVEVGARCVSGGRQFHQDNYAADTNVSRYLDDSRNTTRSRSQILEVKNPNEVGMNRYFPLILGFAVRHVPKTGIGTMIAIMLPYSVALLLAWALMLMSWIALGLPVGLGAGLLLAKGKDRLVSPAKRLPVTTRRALCMTLTTQLRNRG